MCNSDDDKMSNVMVVKIESCWGSSYKLVKQTADSSWCSVFLITSYCLFLIGLTIKVMPWLYNNNRKNTFIQVNPITVFNGNGSGYSRSIVNICGSGKQIYVHAGVHKRKRGLTTVGVVGSS